MRKLLKSEPCMHVHVSGRECGRPAPRSTLNCGLHKAGCIECDKMLAMFPTRKQLKETEDGWV